MKNITVFCGSSLGNDKDIIESAVELGRELAGKNIRMIYGGAKVGLMGTLADSVIGNGGKAVGIIPSFFNQKEVAHDDLTELIIVDTMQERKNIMNNMADGFVVLPGAFGTLDEMFEVLTLSQLHVLSKPVGVLNVGGFFDSMFKFLRYSSEKGFLLEEHLELLISGDSPAELISKMQTWTPPAMSKWFLERVAK
jgi:uncharacterized protein (TIGR00730 family)